MRKILIAFLFPLAIFLFLSCSENEPEENKAPTCIITSIDNGEEIEQGTTVRILVDADDSDGNITNVKFYIDGIVAGVSMKSPHDYEWRTLNEDIGDHTIRAVAEDDLDESTIDEINVKILGARPIVLFSANKTDITQGGNVVFIDQSSNDPINWAWDFGDGNKSTEQNPRNVYSTKGSYAVSLTVTNSYGSRTETTTDYIKVTNGGGATGILTDVDGNTYNTVIIGEQEWMAENLKVTHYANGDPIPLVTEDVVWGNLERNDDAYCYYDNSDTNRDIYGALYTYAAAIDACPTGWHLPTVHDWSGLVNYASNDGHYCSEGVALKSTAGWDNSRDGWNNIGNGTDDYGFYALPSGIRDYNRKEFVYMGYASYWWTSDELFAGFKAYVRSASSSYFIIAHDSHHESNGCSVRCVKDSPLED